MKKVGLIVDEGADLTPEIISKYEIVMVPLKVEWPAEMESIPGETIFHKMIEAEKRGMKIFCKTSQPSPKDYLEIYKKQLEKFEKLICTTVTSKLSGTYNSAVQALNFLPEEKKESVFVVDSLSAICGEGILAMKALELIEQGQEAEEIARQLKDFPSQIELYAILEDPKWLEHAGRLSPVLANWIRQAAKIGVRPLIGFKNGILKAIGVMTGVKDIPEALFKKVEAKSKKDREQGKKIRAFIVHTLNPEGAEKLKKLLVDKLGAEIAAVNLADQVVGSIVGPGALAVAWHLK